MSRPTGFPAHIRAQSLSTSNQSSSQTSNLPHHANQGSISGSSASPVLLQRIAEKKTELANLQELKHLSGELAQQMQQLEARLATLSDGTEAVATVVANWANVLSAIGLATSKLPVAKEDDSSEETQDKELPLPETLVRIPIKQAESTQKAAQLAREEGE